MVGNVKDETLEHFVLKCLIYKRIKELGHKGNCEFDTEGPCGILDVVDWTTGLVYEPQKNMGADIMKSKVEKYLKIGGIRDVIFVPVERFRLSSPLRYWYEKVKTIVA